MARVMFAMESADLVNDLFDASALTRLRDVVDVEPILFKNGMPHPPAEARSMRVP